LFVFFPCLVCRMLPVVLDCPFLIALPFSLTFIQENRITIRCLLLVDFSNISISVPTHRLLKGWYHQGLIILLTSMYIDIVYLLICLFHVHRCCLFTDMSISGVNECSP
jgi:hypothetical protein